MWSGRRCCGWRMVSPRGLPASGPSSPRHLVTALNGNETPRVRLLGSVGQSDLAPNADLAHHLFRDTPLAAGEGLALVNNNAFSTGFAALAIADAGRLLDAMHLAGALDLEAFGANLTIIHPAVAKPAVPGPACLARATDGAPRRQRPLVAGGGAQSPGPAHVPRATAGPRGAVGHARSSCAPSSQSS